MDFLNNSLQIVLVLYQTKIEDSLCFQSLLKYIYPLNLNYELLIYNNSPEIIILSREDCVVINAKQNGMLAEAYRYALQLAIKSHKKWLLLLDQDTELTIEYFEELNKILHSDISEKISAIIPKIQKGNHFIAPKTYFYKLGPSFFTNSVQKAGIYKKCFLAINSGTVLNAEAINETGGFPERFPLDGLDFWYFSQLYKNGKSFYVMNTVLEQNLSVLNGSAISTDRYASILNAELLLNRELGFLAVLLWKIKIPLQVIKRAFYKDKRKFTGLTLSYLFK